MPLEKEKMEWLLRELLKEEGCSERGFLLHSYGGPIEMVEEFVELGARFSFSGYFAQESKAKKRKEALEKYQKLLADYTKTKFMRSNMEIVGAKIKELEEAIAKGPEPDPVKKPTTVAEKINAAVAKAGEQANYTFKIDSKVEGSRTGRSGNSTINAAWEKDGTMWASLGSM